MPASTSQRLAAVLVTACAALALGASPAPAQLASPSAESPAAASSEAASIVITGTLERTFGRGDCFVVRSGLRAYNLIGRVPQAYVGREVVVRGEVLDGPTACQFGTPLRVITIALA